MFGLILILLLAIMGGAIAYIGDKLGTKIGKKRLTVFGLRPKHTSILITIITGVCITACTILLLAAVSRDVRTSLFGMQALQKKLVTLSAAVEEKTNLLGETQKELEKKSFSLGKLSKQVKSKAEQLAKVETELKKVVVQRDRQAKEIALLSQQYQEINRKLSLAQVDINQLQKTKNQLQEKIAGLEKTKEALNQEVAQREELARRLRLGLEIVREGNIALRANEELATQVIAGGQSAKQIQLEMQKLLIQANQTAVQKGAQPLGKGEGPLWLSAQELQKVMEILVRTKKEMVVKLVSSSNTVFNEPVLAKFELFENKKAFTKNEVVWQEQIDGTKSAKEIENQLLSMLKKVNQVALKRGMLPDNITGTIGSVPALDIYNTVKKIKDAQKQVAVQIIATEDVSISDVLLVKLEVKK